MQASADESLASRGAMLLGAVSLLPGGAQLLEICRDDPDSALVGGAVRDLLLGREPRELDVVVSGGGAELAGALAGALRGAGAGEPRVTIHERFRTAAVEWAAGQVDIAERRAESYPHPGSLPQVRAGTALEDLGRRDFTVNAIAVTLGGPDAGAVLAAEHARADLARARLRVLHDQSFRDDPTRLLRLARYTARLHFQAEPGTAALARQALADGALATLTPARVGAELRLALREADAISSLDAIAEIGALRAIDRCLGLDAELARRARELLPADGRADILLLACLIAQPSQDPRDRVRIAELLDAMEFGAGERDRALAAAASAPALALSIAGASRPSQLMRALQGREPEEVALAGAQSVPGAGEAARRWLGELREVRLSITGQDLLAAGVPGGPEIGRRLAHALELRLDGELQDGRDAEITAALEGGA